MSAQRGHGRYHFRSNSRYLAGRTGFDFAIREFEKKIGVLVMKKLVDSDN